MGDHEKEKKQSDALMINEKDNVGVALRELSPGEEVEVLHGRPIRIRSLIPHFHKFALEHIERGEPIVKYGEEIGKASATIEPGEHIHMHNLICERGLGLSADKNKR
ncbi:MAG: UxaA family hydrolase [Deltaproteobacteria bacterium]|nr:UxaA family hydrolase [Deltaproteobacteria bacterium]MBW2307338.1 UxaA family hydrolase [Deltaproteobacteria bacterium]